MFEDGEMDEARSRLQDPQLSADELVRIAEQYPQLRSQVFMHPNCPAGLVAQILAEIPGADASDAEATQHMQAVSEPPRPAEGPVFSPILPPVNPEDAAVGDMPPNPPAQPHNAQPHSPQSYGAQQYGAAQQFDDQATQQFNAQQHDDQATQQFNPQQYGAGQYGAQQSGDAQATQQFNAQAAAAPQQFSNPQQPAQQPAPQQPTRYAGFYPPEDSYDDHSDEYVEEDQYVEEDREPRRRSGAVLPIVIVAVLAIVAVVFAATTLFGGNKDKDPAPNTVAEATDASPSEEPSDEPAKDEDEEEPEEKDQTPLPPQVYAGARGPAPDDAQQPQATVEKDGMTIASVMTPTGNIGCDIRLRENSDDDSGDAGDSIACSVKSWKDRAPVAANPKPKQGTTPYVFLGANKSLASYGGSHEGKFCFEKNGCEDGFKGQKLGYGESVVHGDFVCVSEEHGLTCWNSKTGRGVFLSRSHFITY
ncbi:variant leucine-rich repeat-containing protein [Pseudoglutamicibacter albus]|uniref:Leucine rich repeat variant domain-containing protein n=1 Tax=Pseudoglutamicibacter albus TaxID=98671 RepID=A0ABU1Z177_9MICC|nr:hypothetical protein [Pseudoglutamicibacter albus]MDR7294364.1 hypothetical protein [Pseudoglutamicibacter albus]